MTKLRPCPFCGRETESFLKKAGLHDYHFEIVCPKCGCMQYSVWLKDAHTEYFPSFQEVLENIETVTDYWNTRVCDDGNV